MVRGSRWANQEKVLHCYVPLNFIDDKGWEGNSAIGAQVSHRYIGPCQPTNTIMIVVSVILGDVYHG